MSAADELPLACRWGWMLIRSIRCSKYFPPAEESKQDEVKAEQEDKEAENLAKRLPDPPSADPKLEGEPDNKRQKTEHATPKAAEAKPASVEEVDDEDSKVEEVKV